MAAGGCWLCMNLDDPYWSGRLLLYVGVLLL
jgi:hypothetical protein